MINKIILTLVCAITSMVLTVSPTTAATPPRAAGGFAQANNAFALDLYQQLKDQPGNLFFSPYSLSSALLMTHLGAKENTAAQMAQVLHLEGLADPAAEWRRLQQQLDEASRVGGVKWTAANSLWPQANYPFRDDYLRLLQDQFQAGLFPCDFANAPDTARQRINRWVEDQTQKKITDLLPSGALTPLTRMVLVNAIYLKGSWEHAFPTAATAEAPFLTADGRTLKVPLMTQKQTFAYAEASDWQALAMNYKGGRWSMVFVLPRNPDGLPALEAQLPKGALEQWTTALRPREVTVFLPRFKATAQFMLNQKLAALGMTDAFDMTKADFSGMDGRQANLYLSAVVHKAAVEVNEEGAEAAAASGVVVGVRSAPTRPLVFRADHPFLYFIRDNATGAVIFMGRLSQPSA